MAWVSVVIMFLKFLDHQSIHMPMSLSQDISRLHLYIISLSEHTSSKLQFI